MLLFVFLTAPLGRCTTSVGAPMGRLFEAPCELVRTGQAAFPRAVALEVCIRTTRRVDDDEKAACRCAICLGSPWVSNASHYAPLSRCRSAKRRRVHVCTNASFPMGNSVKSLHAV